MFIQYLRDDPRFYFTVVVSVIISIVLHELAHGWAAIHRGDRTPILLGRMTGNPLVHMGPFAIAALVLGGLAWGQMPIDPTRMRGKYAEATVAAAGPAMNLILAFVALTVLGGWMNIDHRRQFARSHAAAFAALTDSEPPADPPEDLEADPDSPIQDNLSYFLLAFGAMNIALCGFNLLPAPPLDGSKILANFHKGYDEFVNRSMSPGFAILMFSLAFFLGGPIVDKAYDLSTRYVAWVAALGLS